MQNQSGAGHVDYPCERLQTLTPRSSGVKFGISPGKKFEGAAAQPLSLSHERLDHLLEGCE